MQVFGAYLVGCPEWQEAMSCSGWSQIVPDGSKMVEKPSAHQNWSQAEIPEADLHGYA